MNLLLRNLAYFAVSVFLAAAFLLGTTQAYAHHSVRHNIAETVHEMRDVTGGVCSAVMLAPERAVTAKHCTGMTSPALVIDGVKYPITEAYGNPERDVAILIVPNAPCPCAVMGTQAAQEGDWISVVGFPYGIHRVVTYGEVQGTVVDPSDSREYVLATAGALPGNSGGGVFDMHGNLIGIATQSVSEGVMVLYVDFVAIAVTLS